MLYYYTSHLLKRHIVINDFCLLLWIALGWLLFCLLGLVQQMQITNYNIELLAILLVAVNIALNFYVSFNNNGRALVCIVV